MKRQSELLKNKVQKSANLNGYHRHQLLDKIAEIIHRTQNYQSNKRTNFPQVAKQPKITSFLKDPPYQPLSGSML